MVEVPRVAKPEEIRQRIMDWLLAERWELGDAEEARGALWAIRARDPGRRTVILGQESRNPDRLVLHSHVRIDDAHAAKLNALPPPEQEEFCWDLRFKLLEMQVDFSGVSPPLERIHLMAWLYVDDLTRNLFFGRVRRLQTAILAVVWLVRRRLDQPAPSEEADGLEVN